MPTPDIVDTLRAVDPASDAHPDSNSTDAQDLLRTTLALVSGSPKSRRRRAAFPISLGATAVALAVGFGLVQTGGYSASAAVRRAAVLSEASESGRAHQILTGTENGQPIDGNVEMAWSGTDEMYVIDQDQKTDSGAIHLRYELRFVDGIGYRQQQNNGTVLPWENTGPIGSPGSGQLSKAARGAQQFRALQSRITFKRSGTEVINGETVNRFTALGDLSPLDEPTAGFLWGAGGAPGTRTTALDVWTNPGDRLVRIRFHFTGPSVDADATTELTELGQPVVITVPQ